MNDVIVEVSGLAPAKGEAMSMLGAGHSHRPRVEALLLEARRAIGEVNCPLGDSLIGLELVIRRPPSVRLNDATNLLGGVADVLQSDRRGVIDLAHLGDLLELRSIVMTLRFEKSSTARNQLRNRLIGLGSGASSLARTDSYLFSRLLRPTIATASVEVG